MCEPTVRVRLNQPCRSGRSCPRIRRSRTSRFPSTNRFIIRSVGVVNQGNWRIPTSSNHGDSRSAFPGNGNNPVAVRRQTRPSAATSTRQAIGGHTLGTSLGRFPRTLLPDRSYHAGHRPVELSLGKTPGTDPGRGSVTCPFSPSEKTGGAGPRAGRIVPARGHPCKRQRNQLTISGPPNPKSPITSAGNCQNQSRPSPPTRKSGTAAPPSSNSVVRPMR